MNPVRYVAGALLALLVARKVTGSSEAEPAPKAGGLNADTETVDGRTYTIVRLGSGDYLVARINGSLPAATYTFSQTGPINEGGNSADLALLKADVNAFPSRIFA